MIPFEYLWLYAFGSVVTAIILMNSVDDSPENPGEWPISLILICFLIFSLWPLFWLLLFFVTLLGNLRWRKR